MRNLAVELGLSLGTCYHIVYIEVVVEETWGSSSTGFQRFCFYSGSILYKVGKSSVFEKQKLKF